MGQTVPQGAGQCCPRNCLRGLADSSTGQLGFRGDSDGTHSFRMALTTAWEKGADACALMAKRLSGGTNMQLPLKTREKWFPAIARQSS